MLKLHEIQFLQSSSDIQFQINDDLVDNFYSETYNKLLNLKNEITHLKKDNIYEYITVLAEYTKTKNIFLDYDNSDSVPQLENILNKKRLEYFEVNYTKQLINILSEQNFEYGIESEAEIFLNNIISQNNMVFKEWIGNLFFRFFSNSKVIIGLLNIISHLEINKVAPEGPIMAIAALSHFDDEVKEGGIRAFENWESTDYINVLELLTIDKKWLRDYLDRVISFLHEG